LSFILVKIDSPKKMKVGIERQIIFNWAWIVF